LPTGTLRKWRGDVFCRGPGPGGLGPRYSDEPVLDAERFVCQFRSERRGRGCNRRGIWRGGRRRCVLEEVIWGGRNRFQGRFAGSGSSWERSRRVAETNPELFAPGRRWIRAREDKRMGWYVVNPPPPQARRGKVDRPRGLRQNVDRRLAEHGGRPAIVTPGQNCR